MSEVAALLLHYKEVRQRLRYPPNAVPDTGINLKRHTVTAPSQDIVIQPPVLEPLPLPPPLPPIIEAPLRGGLTFSSTLEVTAEEFGLTVQDLRRKNRKRHVSVPRMVACYIGCKHGRGLSWIAKYLGVDHTTILYAKRKIANKIAADPDFARRVQSIEARVEAHHPPAIPPEHELSLESWSKQDGPSEPDISKLD